MGSAGDERGAQQNQEGPSSSGEERERGEGTLSGCWEGAGLGLWLWTSRLYQQLAVSHALSRVWQASAAVGGHWGSSGQGSGGFSQSSEVTGSEGDPGSLPIQVGPGPAEVEQGRETQCLAGSSAICGAQPTSGGSSHGRWQWGAGAIRCVHSNPTVGPPVQGTVGQADPPGKGACQSARRGLQVLPGGAGDHGEAGNSSGGTHGGTGGGDTERRGAPSGATGARSPPAEGSRPTPGGANCKVGQGPKGSGGFLPDLGAVNGARGAAAVGCAWRRCSHCTSRRVWRSGRPILHVEWGGGSLLGMLEQAHQTRDSTRMGGTDPHPRTDGRRRRRSRPSPPPCRRTTRRRPNRLGGPITTWRMGTPRSPTRGPRVSRGGAGASEGDPLPRGPRSRPGTSTRSKQMPKARRARQERQGKEC